MRNRLSLSIKSLAVMLTVSTLWLGSLQSSADAMLIPTQAAQQSTAIDRSADVATIQKTLESKVLRAKLHSLGLTDPEIQTRLSRLSDDQVHQMASQIRAVNPAGDLLIGVLIVVVLILLVIYLFKRI